MDNHKESEEYANKKLETLSEKLESGDATANDVIDGIQTLFSQAGINGQMQPNPVSHEKAPTAEQNTVDADHHGPGAGETVIIKTDGNLNDGQSKCEKCGSTEISLNVDNGKLRCHWCRHEQEPPRFEEEKIDIKQLKGQIIGSGASDAVFDENDAITLKCSSCAAEVIIDTTESTQARCHWCRNTLSLNNQVPNGAVPDKVLPFETKKDAARLEIEKFVNKRQFFAHPQFKKEFSTDNIMGVYMPYMVVDANVKAAFRGEGEILLRTWTESKTVGSGDKKRTVTTRYYDADRYAVSRNFDMTVEGLTIESNSEKLQHKSSTRTNNVINAIKPFDLEKSMQWNSNYMTGYTAQKRDTNVDDLKGLVEVKITDVARHQILDSIKAYDRGVRWQSENLDVIGKQWKAAYFPIWLYSYQQPNKNIHYVAVNGQSLKTMGSVPIHHMKLFIFSLMIGIIAAVLLGLALEIEGAIAGFFIGTAGFYFINYSKYRNKDARHNHENSTKAAVRNMMPADSRTKKIRRTTAASLSGRNSTAVNYKGS